MYDKFILILKGAIIGIANIIPGVSGGTLAITMGLYERLIKAITTFFKDFKNNIKFLFPIGIGAVIGLLLVSKLIAFSFDNYPVPTNIFFVSLILGGLPMLFKKVKGRELKDYNIFILLIVAAFLIGLTFINSNTNMVSFDNMNLLKYTKLFIVGIIGAATMVIPGISGSFVFMLLGYYRPILNIITNLTSFYKMDFNTIINQGLILLPFGLGVTVGIVIIAKIIEYFLNKFETTTYYAIIGFVIGSVVIIIKPLFDYTLTLPMVIMSIILGMAGFIIAYFLGER